MNISASEAESILYSLRSGVVPPSGIDHLTCGRDELIAQTGAILEETNNGEAAPLIIKGEDGAGKSHACSIIGKMALDAGFAVSLMNVHEGLLLNKMLDAYNHVLMNMQVPDLPDISGVKTLLREWMCGDTKAQLIDRLKSDIDGKFTAVTEKLRYGVKAIAYFYDRAERNILNKQDALEKEDVLIQWLTGESVPTAKVVRDILLEVFKKLRIRALTLKEDNVSEMLEGFVILLRFIGYSGLVALIDEGENASEHSHDYTQRGKVYQYLDGLLNHHSIENLLTVYAISPSTVLNITNNCKGGTISLPQFIVRPAKVADNVYDLQPLSLPEMHKLAMVIRQLHSTAYNWDAQKPLSDETISDFCAKTYESGRPVRHLIRNIVEVLDTAKQNPDFNVTTNIPEADLYDKTEKEDVTEEAEEVVSAEKIITEEAAPKASTTEETINKTAVIAEPVEKKTRRKSTASRTRKQKEPEFIPIKPIDKDALTNSEKMAISTIREYLTALEEGYNQTPPNVLICETAIKALQRANQLELIRKMKGKIPVSKIINSILAEM